jgi:hypothetical protein
MDILLSPSALKLVGAVDPNRVTRHDLSQRQAMPRSRRSARKAITQGHCRN